ncbi:hypothetical protein ACFXKG_09570 [Streptomyces sp. NPDC059255]|uniref:hypothetical protein n=1 Tax=Streptomyces sp. NPDC059255 TaxID=3346793 RepID=UPI00369D82F3
MGSEEPLEEAITEALADAATGPEERDTEQVLTATAHLSLQRAIDLLALAGSDDEGSEPGALADLVAFCARATAYWAEKTGEGARGDGVAFFAWLKDVKEDDEFLDRLHDEVADWERRTDCGTAVASPRQWESFALEGGPPRTRHPRGPSAACPPRLYPHAPLGRRRPSLGRPPVGSADG